MKQAMQLSTLMGTIAEQRKLKRDFIIPTSDLRMYPYEGTMRMDWKGNQGDPVNVLQTAHRQISSKLEIPAKYYDRMQAEQPNLLAQNVNTWLHGTPEDRMLRIMKDDLRAFLSNRYRRLDNDDLLQALLPYIMDRDDVRIESCAITEQRMYIKALFSRITGEVKRGDVVQFGVIISNSEIGYGAIEVSPLVLVLKCLNGMVMQDNRVRRNHVGRAAANDGEAYELYSDETLKADDLTVFMKMRDLVKAILEPAATNKILHRLQQAAGEKIIGNPLKAAEEMAKANLFNEDESKQFFDLFIREGDYSKWGLSNGITALSQRVESYDRATELERLGGQVIDLPQSQWRSYAEAA